MLLAFVVGYGVCALRKPQPPYRIAAVNHVHQVGLEFRQFRNDMTLHGATGVLATPATTSKR